MLQSMRKHGITLALFAAGSTGLTAAINELTKSTIEDQAAQQQKALFDQVMPANLYNNDLLKSCYRVTAPELGKGEHKVWIAQNGDKAVAAVMEATAPDGYSGAIQLLVAADFKGTVLGTRVTEHHETPGTGDKIELRISDWITLFADKVIHGQNDSHWAVKKMAAISISLPGLPLLRARWSMPSSARACMRKLCPRRFLLSLPVETRP